MQLRRAGAILWQAAQRYISDRCPTMGAAIAYYTAFSLGPLLLLVIAVAGLIWGEDAAQGAIEREIGDLVGKDGARVVQTMIRSAADVGEGVVAGAIGVGALLLGATTVMAELQASLNVIWRAAPSPHSTWWTLLRNRLLSFTLILVMGFLLLVSLVLSAAVSAVRTWIQIAPGAGILLRVVDLLLPFAIVTLLFAAIFKLLPDARIAWRDTWFGAAVTALLFSVGKFAIGLYIGSTGVGSVFGAAGTLAVLLVWVYYSAQIFLFGAEVTKSFAEREGSQRSGGTAA